MIEAALLELYESECTLAAPAARRRDGKVSHGDPVTERCHMEVQVRRVLNQQGEEVTAAGRVHLTDARPEVATDWLLTLPDGRTPSIVAVETTYGENLDTGANGPYQTLIYYGG